MRPRAPDLKRLIVGAGPPGLRRALGLARLAIDEAAGVDALIALALTDVPDGGQTSARLANLIRRVFGSDKAAAPAAARSTATVIPWIDRLLSREPVAAARALTLLRTVDLAGALRPWRAWEEAHGDRLARAHAVADREPFTGGPKLEDRERIIAGLDRARAALPPVINLGRILQAVDMLADAKVEAVRDAAIRFVAALPEDRGPVDRARFVEHAADVSKYDEDYQKAAWLWDAVTAELRAGAHPRILAPWKAVFEGKSDASAEWPMLRLFRRQSELRRFGAALAHLGRDLPFTARNARSLAAVLAAGLDAESAASLTRRLDLVDVNPRQRLVSAGVALVGAEDPAALVAPVCALHAACAEHGIEMEEPLARLCEHAGATDDAWLIVALLARDLRRAVELASLASFVPRGRWPRLCAPASRPVWIAAYPSKLAEPLAHLAATDPDAERTARRRTAPDLADRDALEREVTALRARSPLGPRQARRLANLQARIAAPRPPTAARLERLAARIDAAAVEIGAARFAAALSASAQARLAARLGVEVAPGWTADRTLRAVLLGLLDLEPEDLTLARRLLEARRGPPPWDLREDPKNRAFLARLRAHGVDPTAWLSDAPRIVTGGDGQPVELAFCHDPLEVFAMGAHFSTCLSPGGGNFFSVVTNAADVNKRVLYARRDGKVAGRCLLALTDAGDLLTFHPYSHDQKLGFDEIVRQLAIDLAARMGTRVASTGRVTTLLGRDWYDDGVRDLVGRYGPLEGAAFAKALQEVPVASAIPLIVKTLGRDLDDVTLPFVVASTALESRPELVVALVPLLFALTLPDQTLIRAADLATRAGQSELADRLLFGPASRADLRYSSWYWGQVLARVRPSFALARLRQTRSRGVRGWNDEFGARLAVAGLAMEHLHRPRQAAAMYRRAIEDDPWLTNELADRVAALERIVGH